MGRRLAAIPVADVVGYSRLVEQDEAGTRATSSSMGDDIYGDGVNVAARLEALAEAGGTWLFFNCSDRLKLVFIFYNFGVESLLE